MARTTRLTVITGGGVANTPWLTFPATIAAKSPSDAALPCTFRVSAEDAVRAALANRKQPVLDFWANVVGAPPPVPNINSIEAAHVGLCRLDQAHACFQGIRRPLCEYGNGDDFLVYILKPKFVFRYRPNLVCIVEKLPAPDGFVFAVYGRLDVPPATEATLIKGTLTHWDFVESDAVDPYLPVDHKTRYTSRLW